MLREIARLDVVSQVTFPGVMPKHSGKYLEQRGLAGAVWADKHDTLLSFHLEIE